MATWIGEIYSSNHCLGQDDLFGSDHLYHVEGSAQKAWGNEMGSKYYRG